MSRSFLCRRNPHDNFLFSILALIGDSKIIQISFKCILRGEAGVGKVTLLLIPFFQSTIIKHFNFIFDNKRNYTVF